MTGLWSYLTEARARALASGALQPIASHRERLSDGGVDFIIHVVDSLPRKQAAARPAASNPFLPYEPDLFVTELSDTHVALLNKYNVVDHHLLIVTRQFEEQSSRLNARDFAALWQCLEDMDGLGFYNAGPLAGASQRHKHLQWLPLPLAPDGAPVPVGPLLENAALRGQLGICPELPFRHALARLPGAAASAQERSQQTEFLYRRLLRELGCGFHNYNLLLTRRWMLMVPRSQESCEGIGINALGYAGMLLLRDAAQATVLQHLGPMNLLRLAALPPAAEAG